MPNLFILGAARCGTTFLWDALRMIPGICMSNPKEPIFFEFHYDQGLEFYRRKYFSHWKGEHVIGEARHRNLFLPFIPESIYKTNPAAKLIVMVRDPVERAYSHWWRYYSGRHVNISFAAAIKKNYARIASGIECKTREKFAGHYKHNKLYMNDDTYIDSGYYYQQIERYRRYFPDGQIKVIFFDDIVEKPREVISDVVRFLGLLETPGIDFDRVSKNESLTRRSAIPAAVAKALRDSMPAPAFSKLYRLCARLAGEKKPAMEPAARAWLKEHYRSHNKKLEEYVKREAPWRRSSYP